MSTVHEARRVYLLSDLAFSCIQSLSPSRLLLLLDVLFWMC